MSACCQIASVSGCRASEYSSRSYLRVTSAVKIIHQNELVAVLKANHLSSAKAVGKKAQTIMRQADADGSGTLTLDEFIVVAKKFPNLVSLSDFVFLPHPSVLQTLVDYRSAPLQ